VSNLGRISISVQKILNPFLQDRYKRIKIDASVHAGVVPKYQGEIRTGMFRNKHSLRIENRT
jgi:ribosomal protein L21E